MRVGRWAASLAVVGALAWPTPAPADDALTSGAGALPPSTSETTPHAAFDAFWIEPGHLLNDATVRDDVDGKGVATVDRVVDEMHDLGARDIVVAYVEFAWGGWGPFYPSQIDALGEPRIGFDAIGTLLRRASVHGMDVWLGLGRGPDGPLDFDGSVTDEEMRAAAAFSATVAAELVDFYGDEPSLAGWYFSHEANDFSRASVHYEEAARLIRLARPSHAALRTMVAPAGTPTGMVDYLQTTTIDVFAYQDAVGPGYVGPDTSCPHCVGYTYTYEPSHRIADLDRIFAEYRAWHDAAPVNPRTGKRPEIWSDTEVWQMSGPTYANPYAAPCARVAEQIRAVEPHVDRLSAYEYLGYLESPADDTNVQRLWADDLYRAYSSYVADLQHGDAALCPGGDPRMHRCQLSASVVDQLAARCRATSL